MSLREHPTRTGLQIALESPRRGRVGELQRDDEGPGAMRDRCSAGTAVVPAQSFLDIARNACVVAVRINGAAEDIDEALVVHAGVNARSPPWLQQLDLAGL